MDFLDKLKKAITRDAEENGFNACEYFETILQHKEKLSPILKDAENFSNVNIHYDTDDGDGYTNGYFTIYFNNDCQNYANHKYKIALLHDQRMWGYCECQPSDEGYDPIHKCCGNGCDWYAPSISIEKIECLASFSFNGTERDMWELERKWNGKEDLENEKLNHQMFYIDEQIKRLIEEKSLIEKKLNETT